MISINSDSLNAQVGALVKAFDTLPKHIAKKHMKSAMKKALKFAVPVLKSNTPKSKGKKGADGKKIKGSSGGLRRAVTVRSKFIGKNKGGFTVGAIGYKHGEQSRKAIWVEFGTARGISPQGFMDKTYNQIRGQVSDELTRELAHALEMAAKDSAPGVDQNYRRK